MATLICILRRTYGANAMGERTGQIVLRVESAIFDEPEPAILAATGYIMGQPHPYDAGLYCAGMKAELDPTRKRNGWWWTVTVDFTTKPRMTCNDITITDPLKMRPIVTPLFEKREVLVKRARLIVANEARPNPQAITSSAGQLYIDPLSRPETQIGWRIVRNEAEADIRRIRRFIDRINSKPFRLLGQEMPAYTCRLRTWLPEEQWIGQCERYFRHTYEIEVGEIEKEEINDAYSCSEYYPFDEVIVDQGTAELNDEDKLEVIRDDKGVPISDPVMLDGGGRQLEQPIDDTNPAFTMAWRTHREADFAELELPED